MTEAKHTPGPWLIDDYRGDSEGRSSDDICAGSYEDHNHISIATIWNCGGRGFPSDDEFVANARLIAAAPETAAERDRLREVNADLLAAVDVLLNLCALENIDSPAIDKAQAARTKAVTQ